MFKSFSMTYGGAISTFLVAFFSISQADADTFVNVGILIITTLVTLYGRVRKGDVDWLGMRLDK